MSTADEVVAASTSTAEKAMAAILSRRALPYGHGHVRGGRCHVATVMSTAEEAMATADEVVAAFASTADEVVPAGCHRGGGRTEVVRGDAEGGAGFASPDEAAGRPWDGRGETSLFSCAFLPRLTHPDLLRF